MDRINQNKIKEYIFEGKKMLAIKYYRDITGRELIDSKKYVEGIEKELMNQYPEKFNLPKPTKQQYQNENIRSKDDLVKAISDITKDFEVINFGPILMGWSADIVIKNKRYCIYSHRFEISCQYIDENTRVDIELNSFIDNLTDKQVVHKFINKILEISGSLRIKNE